MRPSPELQQRIAYTYRDDRLLERALTHRSFTNENRLAEHNERMEFLGDAVLNLVVSELLMQIRPASSEGDLSRYRAAVVSEESLAAAARHIGLGEFLRLGRGEEQSGGREKGSLLADSLEALIASLYLDGGIAEARAFIDRVFHDAVRKALEAGASRDFKTELQELSQERLRTLPQYRVVSEAGPDHRKSFTVELTIGAQMLGRGTGRSKKDAEQKAAREALERLRRQDEKAKTRR